MAKLKVKDKVWVIVEHRDGHVEIHRSKGKTITDAGLNWLMKRSYSDTERKIEYGAIGTGTNTPQASDTELQTEKLRKLFSVMSNPSTGKAHFEFVIDWTELNGETLTEVGIFNDPETGTMLLRKLLSPAIVKSSDKKPTIIVEVTISGA